MATVIARDRLLHIAVIIQAEIIKSLQVAVKHEVCSCLRVLTSPDARHADGGIERDIEP